MGVSKFEVVQGDKKEPCPYCGSEAHVVPLACPRICGVTLYKNEDAVEIHFWPDEDGDPDDGLPMAG